MLLGWVATECTFDYRHTTNTTESQVHPEAIYAIRHCE